MRRRDFISVVGGTAMAVPFAPWLRAAHAQHDERPVIGMLQSSSLEGNARRVDAFLRGLEEAGFVDGKNVTIIYRWADNQVEKLAPLAADLVRHNVAVIATPASMPATRAARAATSSIPIVFATGADPVAAGVVASLSRPGGNVTGVTSLNIDVASKRLDLLHQLVPQAKRCFVLVNPASPVAASFISDVRAGASRLDIQIETLRAGTESEIDAAFAGLPANSDKVLLSSPEPFLYSRRAQIIALAARYDVAAGFDTRDYVNDGGLLSYGAHFLAVLRRAGVYVGRILKGERPASLPVEQSDKFELAINLRTAKALGLTIPAQLLAVADDVIE
ncbi:MAG: ABC transporter substrate-binding protein [Rhodospirillaceae bacterium]